MMKIACILIVIILFILSMFIGLLAGPVPDTGQSKCYNNTSEIPCPQEGEPFYGQDAHYITNPPSYTKLDANGNEGTNSDGSWSMVRDNVTGLIWEVKTDDGSIHDKDNSYTWHNSNSATNGGNAGVPGDGTDTEDFIYSLNANNFGGFSDWRLPTINELAFIENWGNSWPAINTTYFPFTVSFSYWSSTTHTHNIDCAWLVSFDYGYTCYDSKSNGHYVRAVRGGQ